MASTDLLVVSAANTRGWSVAAEALAASIRRAGARAEVVTAEPPRRVRTFMLTDLIEAASARRATQRGIEVYEPRQIVYCSITAALLWPRPGAIYLDSLAAENRPGRHGIWQRQVERRRVGEAPLVLAMSPGALRSLRGSPPPTALVPIPVDTPQQPVNGERDIAALTYAGDPVKRRLSLVLEAWTTARRGDETLVVAGFDAPSRPGVRAVGGVSPEEFHSLLTRARVFVAAPRREEYGIAALEALAHGCLLVSAPAPGGYPALELARQLDPRLVSHDLARAVRTALDEPLPDYAQRAAELLEPFSRGAVDKTVAERVLPRLLSR
ncbi:MAG TPA: glycosyltransferase [Solirubrobacteraceae bacterium]|nr:glycosyltransferase [Solirubrobacteraceae bacterium]